MRLFTTCGHTFDLPGTAHPDAVKCAACDRQTAVWAVDLKPTAVRCEMCDGTFNAAEHDEAARGIHGRCVVPPPVGQ